MFHGFKRLMFLCPWGDNKLETLGYKKVTKKCTFKPTPEQLIRINTLCLMGLPLPKLAKFFGLTEAELDGCRKRDPELRHAMESGMRDGDERLMSGLWQQAEEGNTAVLIFLAKVRLRMRERDRDEQNGNLPPDKKQDKIVFKAMSPVEAARVYQQIMRDS